jgi:carbonic anhydrase
MEKVGTGPLPKPFPLRPPDSISYGPGRARPSRPSHTMLNATLALQRLRDGNRRFVAGEASTAGVVPGRLAQLATGQTPFAIVLGCSDSRVPAELVFDQGFGDLFVIRVAGNIVAPSQVGSVEFAASQFDTRLVVVMGHTQCGAVTATLDELLGRSTNASRNLRSIVDRIRPSVEGLVARGASWDPDTLMHEAVRANVRASVNHLLHGSEVIEGLVQRAGLVVVGAEYSLETGEVEFFD